MNRIIIIGNGFDRAHNLRTGYREFIDDYWSNFTNEILDQIGLTYGTDTMIKPYSDGYARIEVRKRDDNTSSDNEAPFLCKEENPYSELHQLIAEYHKIFKRKSIVLHFENKFFEHITNQCSLTSWVDIENEYYDKLKKLLSEEDSSKRNEKVKELNQDFDAVSKLLEKHLNRIIENANPEKHQSIQDAFTSFITLDEIATGKRTEFVDSIFSDMHRYDSPIDFEEDKKRDPQYNILISKDEDRLYYIVEKTVKMTP